MQIEFGSHEISRDLRLFVVKVCILSDKNAATEDKSGPAVISAILGFYKRIFGYFVFNSK